MGHVSLHPGIRNVLQDSPDVQQSEHDRVSFRFVLNRAAGPNYLLHPCFPATPHTYLDVPPNIGGSETTYFHVHKQHTDIPRQLHGYFV